MDGRSSRAPGWMLPAVLSVVINIALICLVLRLVAVPEQQSNVMIAVELQGVPSAQVKSVRMPENRAVTPTVEPPKLRSIFTPISSVAKIFSSVKPVASRTNRTAPSRANGPASPGILSPSSGGGGIVGGLPGGRGHDEGMGAGTIVGRPGDGGGIIGSGTGGASSGSGEGSGGGHGTGHGDGIGSGPSSPPVREAPRGESRGAQVTRQFRPAYPADARDDGVEGTAVVLVSLGANGQVTGTRIERSSGDRRLDHAAEQAVRQWSFSPRLNDGKGEESVIKVNVTFRLD